MRMRMAGRGSLLPQAAYSFRLRLCAPIHTGVVTHLFDVNVISLCVTEAAERLAQELAMIGTLFIPCNPYESAGPFLGSKAYTWNQKA